MGLAAEQAFGCPRLRQNEPDEQGFLLARRTEFRRHGLGSVDHLQVAAVRPGKGAACGTVKGAGLRQLLR